MASAAPRSSWNPLSCAGTQLAVPRLLAAKLIVACLLLTNRLEHPAPAWTFQRALEIAFLASAMAVLFNRGVRFFSIVLGGAILLTALSSRPYFGAGRIFCGLLLVLIGLHEPWLLPLRTAVAASIRRPLPLAIWTNILLQSALLVWTGRPWTVFSYAALASMLILVEWPRAPLVVIYDGDCGICAATRRWFGRFDFDGLYHWRTFQSGAGAEYGITVEALRERVHVVADGRTSAGFRALQWMLLYNPVTYFAIAVLLAAYPAGAALYRRILVVALVAFFFPLFVPVGEALYLLIARNRSRIPSRRPCQADRTTPPDPA